MFELRTLWIAILEHVKREQTLGEGLFGWEVERMVEVEVRERFSSVGKGMDGGFGERPKCARRSTTGEKLRAIREEKEEEEEEDEKGKCGMGWNSKME